VRAVPLVLSVLETAMSQEKLDYFIERTDADMKEIKEDIKKLIGFRSWLFGACAAISALISMAVTIYIKKF
jgi:hypothetical protein